MLNEYVVESWGKGCPGLAKAPLKQGMFWSRSRQQISGSNTTHQNGIFSINKKTILF
jgi:hypothetical protein